MHHLGRSAACVCVPMASLSPPPTPSSPPTNLPHLPDSATCKCQLPYFPLTFISNGRHELREISVIMFDDGHEWRWGGVVERRTEATQQACLFINQRRRRSWRHVSIKVLTYRQMNWLIKAAASLRRAEESEIISRRQFVIISERQKHIEWLSLITPVLTFRSRLHLKFSWVPVGITAFRCVLFFVCFVFFDTSVKC